MKKIYKLILAITIIASIGFVANTLNTLGVVDLTPFYDTLKLKASEFGLIVTAPVILALLGKVVAEFIKDIMNFKADNEKVNTDLKVESDKEIVATNRLLIEQNIEIVTLLQEQATYNKKRDLYISNLTFIPEGLKNDLINVVTEKFGE